MADKLTCPGCDSHTSAVLQAVLMEQPCPYCGLSAVTIQAVMKARTARVSEELVNAFIESEKKSVELRRALDVAETALATINGAMTWHASGGKEGSVL